MRKDSENNLAPAHPAWAQFLSIFERALNEYDCQEALSTDQILEKLQSISFCDWYDSGLLFAQLGKSGFKSRPLDGTNVVVWLVKSVQNISVL